MTATLFLSAALLAPLAIVGAAILAVCLASLAVYAVLGWAWLLASGTAAVVRLSHAALQDGRRPIRRPAFTPTVLPSGAMATVANPGPIFPLALHLDGSACHVPVATLCEEVPFTPAMRPAPAPVQCLEPTAIVPVRKAPAPRKSRKATSKATVAACKPVKAPAAPRVEVVKGDHATRPWIIRVNGLVALTQGKGSVVRRFATEAAAIKASKAL